MLITPNGEHTGIMQFLTVLPLPPTLNHTYGITQSRMYKKKEAVDWQEEIGWKLKKEPKLRGRVSVLIELHLSTDRDIDSSQKLLLDSLQEIGNIENDKLVFDLHIKKYLDSKKPRLVLWVASYDVPETSKSKKEK